MPSWMSTSTYGILKRCPKVISMLRENKPELLKSIILNIQIISTMLNILSLFFPSEMPKAVKYDPLLLSLIWKCFNATWWMEY